MLKYLQPVNWFFVLMAIAITCYIAYNFGNGSSKPPGKQVSSAPANLIRQIVR